MTHRFYIVDVFTEQPYTGNPLAVVVMAKSLSDETMQKIAAEMNFSETTFVATTPEDNGGYRVRIFTPAREIDFAGHPILGTAQVIRQYLTNESSSQILLNLSKSLIPVNFEHFSNESEVAWFLAPPMKLGKESAREPVATALDLAPDDIDIRTPIQVVSAGTSAMIVPLNTMQALQHSQLNLEKFAVLAAEGFPPLIYLFCQQTHHPENDLCARFFFEAHGVREDPATGNGAAFLGAYLLKHRYFSKSDLSLRIEQGYEIHRPSLVRLRARIQNGSSDIQVGGHVIPTVQGQLL